MVECALFALPVAVLLGILAGLGLGGGSLLVIWLTLICGFTAEQARSLNLVFYIPAALITTLTAIRRKTIDVRLLWPAMLCGCVSTLAGSYLARRISQDHLQAALGLILLLAGLQQLLYRPRKAK